ncbi:MAG: cytochrome-c oxidase, cbb3-type subunit III [Steroidobacteraceae bacterium]
MNSFWSGWIMALVVLNLGITLALFITALRLKIPTQPDGTTGHVWAHGVLRESVRKLPLWWVLFSISMFVIGLAYLVLYPGFGSYKGTLGWTSAHELQQDTQANDVKLEYALQPMRTVTIEQLSANPQAVSMGERLYQDSCAACHGMAARGSFVVGAPDLTDGDWLYGDDTQTILASIMDGRGGVMPGWEGVLGRDGVNEVAAYVLSLNGIDAPVDWVAAGKTRFETLCVTCHGVDGKGNRALGAPNLTDSRWLYGGDFASVTQSIRHGRSGVMPPWRHRLSEDQARVIAAWLYTKRQREPS